MMTLGWVSILTQADFLGVDMFEMEDLQMHRGEA